MSITPADPARHSVDLAALRRANDPARERALDRKLVKDALGALRSSKSGRDIAGEISERGMRVTPADSVRRNGHESNGGVKRRNGVDYLDVRRSELFDPAEGAALIAHEAQHVLDFGSGGWKEYTGDTARGALAAAGAISRFGNPISAYRDEVDTRWSALDSVARVGHGVGQALNAIVHLDNPISAYRAGTATYTERRFDDIVMNSEVNAYETGARVAKDLGSSGHEIGLDDDGNVRPRAEIRRELKREMAQE